MKTNTEISLHSYENVYSIDKSEDYRIEVIIDKIQRDSRLEELVTNIRSIDDKKQRDKFKEKNLPVFRPGFYEEAPTGIIQFDIDFYNLELSTKIKEFLIIKLSSLLYAFISPSNGLKFALMTDFNGTKEDYINAYRLIEKQIRKGLYDTGFIDDLNFDDGMSSITKLCYLSSDSSVYHNLCPSIYELPKYLPLAPQKESKITRPQYCNDDKTKVSDEDKFVFLNAILFIKENRDVCLPKGNGKRTRINLANAIIVIFGIEDGTDIILHDLHLFGGDGTYLASIIKENDFDSAGVIINIARKGGFEGITKTFKDKNTGGNTERVRLIPKDSSRPKRYSTVEATQLIDERIKQFFYEGKSIQLIVEMGLGKTLYASRHAERYLDYIRKNNGNVRIAIFVPSHKLGNEILPKTEGNEITLSFDFDEDTLEFSLNNTKNNKVIGGYSRTCKKLEDLPEEIVKGRVRNSYECKDCQFREHGCRYMSQFTIQDNLIRIYPHNYLYNSAKEDKDYKPDFVIIDEDPTGHSTIENLYNINSGKLWKKILEEGFKSVTTADYNSEKKMLKLKIDGTRYKLKHHKEDITLSNSFNNLLTELKVINLLLKRKARITTYKDEVHVLYKRPILKKWLKDVPLLYLNGTGNKDISDAVFGENKFDITEEIRVKYNPNVTVYQLQNQSLSQEQAADKKNQIFEMMDYFYHYSKSCFISYKKIIDGYRELHPETDSERFMYFGDTRGKGGFENCNIILVIGRHYVPHQALSAKGSVLLETDYIEEDRIKRTRVIEMNNDEHDAELEVLDFADPYMQTMSSYYNEGEVLQAIHRLRLLHGTDKKTVIYLSNFVIDGLLVDKFLISDDILLNDNRMALVRAVQKEGIIKSKKPSIIAEKAGLTTKQISNLKNTEWYNENVFFYVDDITGHLVDKNTCNNIMIK